MDQNQNPEINGEVFAVEAIRGELRRILESRTFRAAQGQRKFLAYTVEEVLAGHAHLLKEYVIATEALDEKPLSIPGWIPSSAPRPESSGPGWTNTISPRAPAIRFGWSFPKALTFHVSARW